MRRDEPVTLVALARAAGVSKTTASDAVRALLGESIDALVCASDGSAMAALPVLRAAGRRIGADLPLASCVDSTLLGQADPPVTAIDLRPREAGAACAQLLSALLNGEAGQGATRRHPIGLVTRSSTASP